MPRQTSSPLLLTLFLLLGVLPARADTLYLRNGKTLEGLVEEETDNYVRLNMGVASMKISRGRIDAIARSVPSEQAAIEAKWGEKYYTHSRYAPEGQRDLAARFNSVEAQQRSATRAYHRIQRYYQDRRTLQQQVSTLEKESVAVSARLAEAVPEEDVEAYNELVARNNALGARAVVLRNKLQHRDQLLEEDNQAIADYMGHFYSLLELFEARAGGFDEAGPPPEQAHFFDTMRTRLAALGEQFRASTVPAEEAGGHLTVEATINDRGTARLLLDTGASVVTLSQAAAHRLGVKLAGRPNAEFRLADGSTIQAESVVLDAVQVGDVRVEQVRAAVLPDSAAAGRDGLLGLSFLRDSVMEYDVAGKALMLRRFQPQ